MTDEELRTLVASNAQAIERNTQAIGRMEENFERLYNRVEQRYVAIDARIELVSRQLQAVADRQENSDSRILHLERMMNGVYEILRTNAEEQAKRSALIDQQIQALIDQRRQA